LSYFCDDDTEDVALLADPALSEEKPRAAAKLTCRPIADDDLPAVVACLQRGFPDRAKAYWESGLARLARRDPLDDLPRYGLALDADGAVVGVLLQIFSRRGDAIFCNLSSWCVDAAYRGASLALSLQAARRKDVTYLNISPAAHTLKTIEAQGFRRYSEGQVFAAPILSRPRKGMRIVDFSPSAAEARALSPGERQILADHAALGCRALLCVDGQRVYPFVFQPRAVLRSLVPCPTLVYCRNAGELVDCAHAIGRDFLRSGIFLLALDAVGSVSGLVGRYFPNRLAKYYKAPVKPVLGDLAYTELTLFGP
jgi:hypothetical protein